MDNKAPVFDTYLVDPQNTAPIQAHSSKLQTHCDPPVTELPRPVLATLPWLVFSSCSSAHPRRTREMVGVTVSFSQEGENELEV